jgi:hypothetical protein
MGVTSIHSSQAIPELPWRAKTGVMEAIEKMIERATPAALTEYEKACERERRRLEIISAAACPACHGPGGLGGPQRNLTFLEHSSDCKFYPRATANLDRTLAQLGR